MTTSSMVPLLTRRSLNIAANTFSATTAILSENTSARAEGVAPEVQRV